MSHCAHGILTKRAERAIFILLVLEDEKVWSLPGGTQEGNETPEETLKRELREEIMVELEEKPSLLYEKIEHDHLKNPQYTRYLHSIDTTEEQLALLNNLDKPSSAVRFFQINCLPRNTRKKHKDFIRHIFKKELRRYRQKKNEAPN